ncbi:tellurite resistance TerB family protein [Achromobacter sp. GG226]|uniref:tellurite resistance TerB family protein n=1 Tax=Verticiella alkaliphila TaxID=2779529 RepID=UPI001C0CBBC0|nr:tellurite resistance TerB family protein [Verticiella sp. GG226]MBU4610447.1 tellurite resistance TerB family protein [Verticiella sp. GG226]
MSARQLLDQLLQSGQGLVRQAAGQVQSSGGGKGGGLSPMLSGALSGGAISLLMGSKGARKYGGKAVKYGGMAALGALAFKAYQQWQTTQSGQAAPSDAPATMPAALPAPRTMDRLPAPEVEQHSKAVLIAMIGAAKADGHIGDAERGLLEGELVRLGEAQDRPWVQEELARPLDPAQVATHAQTPEMAAEMYLASLLVVDEESFMERAYLDELARRLNLAPELKSTLEAQVKTV